MKINELSQRYGLTEPMMAEFLKSHYENINETGEHLKNVNKEWIIDDDGLTILDSMLPKPKPVVTPDVQKLQEDKEVLQQKMQQLTDENEKLKKDYQTISQHLAGLRKEREPFDKALANYQKRVEEAELENQGLQQRLDTTLQSVEQRDKDRLTRIDELTAELERQKAAVSEMQQENFKRMELQKQNMQLYQKIEQLNKTIDQLKKDRDTALLEAEQAKKYARNVQQQAALAVCSLAAAENQLNKVVKGKGNPGNLTMDVALHYTTTQAGAATVTPMDTAVPMPKASTPPPLEAKPTASKDKEVTGREKQEAYQKSLMDEMREKNNAPKRGLFSRISGLLKGGTHGKAAL